MTDLNPLPEVRDDARSTLLAARHVPAWLRHAPDDWRDNTLDRDGLHRAVAKLRCHPNFSQAMRQYAAHTLSSFQSNWALNRLMKEQGRYAFLVFVLYLHHARDGANTNSGVTYTSLCELFAQNTAYGPLASPTRIKLMISLGRIRGQLVLLPSADQRLRVLQPTKKMIEPTAEWLRGFLEAAAMVKALPPFPQDYEGRAHLLGAVMSYTVFAYQRSQFIMYEPCPEVREFTKRDNGYLVLMMMIERMQYPAAPGGDIQTAVPTLEFAKRYAVSRGTVRNVLGFAEQQGWIKQTKRGGHEIIVSPAFAETCERWVALELEWMGEMASAAATSTHDVQAAALTALAAGDARRHDANGVKPATRATVAVAAT
jgi:hypothetical protein